MHTHSRPLLAQQQQQQCQAMYVYYIYIWIFFFRDIPFLILLLLFDSFFLFGCFAVCTRSHATYTHIFSFSFPWYYYFYFFLSFLCIISNFFHLFQIYAHPTIDRMSRQNKSCSNLKYKRNRKNASTTETHNETIVVESDEEKICEHKIRKAETKQQNPTKIARTDQMKWKIFMHTTDAVWSNNIKIKKQMNRTKNPISECCWSGLSARCNRKPADRSFKVFESQSVFALFQLIFETHYKFKLTNHSLHVIGSASVVLSMRLIQQN